jgi:hypothetical protein
VDVELKEEKLEAVEGGNGGKKMPIKFLFIPILIFH